MCFFYKRKTMSDIKERNARIKSTELIYDRWLTAYVHLEGDGWGQGFGGYLLSPIGATLNAPNYTGVFIEQVLKTLGLMR
jgi:hypothetical protein